MSSREKAVLHAPDVPAVVPASEPDPAGIVIPPDAVWFGLERQRPNGTQWDRVERPEWGDGARWWLLSDAHPLEIAVHFGPGKYRAIWRRADRRLNRGQSKAFIVAPPQGQAMPAATAQQAMTPQTFHPAGFLPAGQVGALDPAHPMALFYQLHSVYRDDRAGERERDMQQFAMMLEVMRAGHTTALQQQQQFFTTMSELTGRIGAQVQRVEADKTRAAVGSAFVPLAKQLEEVNRKIAELGALEPDEEEGDEEQRASMLARLGENPNDLERVMTGLQQIFVGLANSPFGKPIGEALAKRMGVQGRVPTVPVDEAAE